MKKLTIHLYVETRWSYTPAVRCHRRTGRPFCTEPYVANIFMTFITIEIGPTGFQSVEVRQTAFQVTIENPDFFP